MVTQIILQEKIEHARNTEKLALHLREVDNPAAEAFWNLSNKLWREANDYSLRLNIDITNFI